MAKAQVSDRGTHIFGRPVGLVVLASYKAVWGTAEAVIGSVGIFSSRLISHELTDDPQDLLANWFLTNIGVARARQIGTVILVLGIIKIALAFGVWYRSWFIRHAALAFFSVVAVYGLYENIFHFRLLSLGALAMDLFFVFYFWKILPKHLHDRAVSSDGR